MSSPIADTDRWWRAPELRGELDAILSLVSAGRAQTPLDEERAARKFCDALNRAWNARARLSNDAAPESDWARLKALVCGLSREDGLALLRSSAVDQLVAIDPPVLNHRKLLDHGVLGSVEEIPDRARREASEAHVKLRRRLEALPSLPADEHLQQVLVRLTELLYVIRSNLQHGEKFSSVDPVRIARDRVIAERAVGVFELFFDLLLARPSTCLAAYGALAPGGAMHSALTASGGQWVPAVVRGELRTGVFPALIPTQAGGEVAVQLLLGATGLPDLWLRLDELEGASYLRVLVPVETEQGELLVANLYAAAS